ncbi:hypothetical protein [Herbihabitans rhizosphaerae]|uniref:hypothetical protein n=1 Tax=Herbihabitans rhizosphaerae TaxID=1872711 RepID=UPI00102B92CC|nr:hypothetical protein [Herbihabitans rhizosphaerae]
MAAIGALASIVAVPVASAATPEPVAAQAAYKVGYPDRDMGVRATPHWNGARVGGVKQDHGYYISCVDYGDGLWWTKIKSDSSRWGFVPSDNLLIPGSDDLPHC